MEKLELENVIGELIDTIYYIYINVHSILYSYSRTYTHSSLCMNRKIKNRSLSTCHTLYGIRYTYLLFAFASV